MTKITHEFDLYGKHYALTTGELAKQATGECLVSCGDSTVNVTVVVSKERKSYDFFPLTVDFIEKNGMGRGRFEVVDAILTRLGHPAASGPGEVRISPELEENLAFLNG